MMKEPRAINSKKADCSLLFCVKITMFTLATLLLSAVAFANPYPTTLDNGNLVLVDGGMGVGRYAARSSVAVEQYAPPDMRFFGEKTGYSPVLKRQRRVVDDSLYRALGI